MIRFNFCRLRATGAACATVFLMAAARLAAAGQSLSVLPVNLFLQPGQNATSLTVTNQASTETAIQIRVYAWNQTEGEDQLTASDAIVVSPPIISIAPQATQVVRLILRQPPRSQEATYRILVD